MKSESLTKDCNRITRDNTAAEPSSEHASAGNLHFLVGVNFGTLSEVDKYAAFMEEMTTLIVSKYDGSLKAEHGTGRNIAPFLEKEWGPKATALMWRIKKLFDPRGLLAPGVMLNKDPVGHPKKHAYISGNRKRRQCLHRMWVL
jgi:FAD/FMN-containing dehydrogenase